MQFVHQMNGFAEVVSSLKTGSSAAIDGAWGSSRALVTAALAGECPQTVLVVLPQVHAVDDFADDFAGFCGTEPAIFPAWETLPQEHDVSDATFGGRLRTLRQLADERPPTTLVTSFPALLQPVPSREARKQNARVLRVGDEVPPEELLRWLVEHGFERMPAISVPGEMSLHGGIVDVFPTDAVDPLRLEFFGDEIESIRRFDAETQRKLEDLTEAEISVVSPLREDADDSDGGNSVLGGESLLDSLPPHSWVVLVDLAEIVQEGRQYLNRLADPRGEPGRARRRAISGRDRAQADDLGAQVDRAVADLEHAAKLIEGTEDDRLYRNQRTDPLGDEDMRYELPLPEGGYQVRLHFAETDPGRQSVGARTFGVTLEDRPGGTDWRRE